MKSIALLLGLTLVASILVVAVSAAEADAPIQGIEGDPGCSGNPNPPSEIDVWKYKRGVFTPRQDDIRIGDCYNGISDNSTITITQRNGTTVDLSAFKNGTVILN